MGLPVLGQKMIGVKFYFPQSLHTPVILILNAGTVTEYIQGLLSLIAKNFVSHGNNCQTVVGVGTVVGCRDCCLWHELLSVTGTV